MCIRDRFYDAQAAIKKHDQEAYDILLKNAENKRDGYLKKAEEEVKKAAEAARLVLCCRRRYSLQPRSSFFRK